MKTRSHHVADVMTRNVVSVSEDIPAAEIARTLEKHRIKRVPVVREGQVVGIVSRSNLLHALAHAKAGALPQPSESGEELRRAVEASLAEVPGAAVNTVNLTV